MIDHLFPAVSLRDQINGFLDRCLLNNPDENDQTDQEARCSGFVLIQRFPKFNEKTIEQNSYLIRAGLIHILDRCKDSCEVEMTPYFFSY